MIWWILGGGCAFIVLGAIALGAVLVWGVTKLPDVYDSAYKAMKENVEKERARRPHTDLYKYAAIYMNPAAVETSVVWMQQPAPSREQLLAAAQVLAKMYYRTDATVLILDDEEAANKIGLSVQDEAAIGTFLRERASPHLVGVLTSKDRDPMTLETRRADGSGWETTKVDRPTE